MNYQSPIPQGSSEQRDLTASISDLLAADEKYRPLIERWEKQGSAIDPNGRTARIAVSTDPTLFSDQGSAIDPNGED